MGNATSADVKVYKAAKKNDVESLKSLVRQFQNHRHEYRGSSFDRFLEWEDSHGCTALLVACAKGHYQCVELLIQHGANKAHMSGNVEGGSALHEAVAHKQEMVAELLLHNGCSPFVENCKGITAVDLAIKSGHTSMLRRLESHAMFTGHMLLKVPRFGGISTEWARRWVVVVPRFPCPLLPQEQRRGYHAMLLAYKRDDQATPCCRLFVNGASAAAAVPKGGHERPSASYPQQCSLRLHRAHAQPTGIACKSDQAAGGGYLVQLRPENTSLSACGRLRQLMDIINQGGAVPAPTPSPQQQQQRLWQQQPASPPGLHGTGSIGGSPRDLDLIPAASRVPARPPPPLAVPPEPLGTPQSAGGGRPGALHPGSNSGLSYPVVGPGPTPRQASAAPSSRPSPTPSSSSHWTAALHTPGHSFSSAPAGAAAAGGAGGLHTPSASFSGVASDAAAAGSGAMGAWPAMAHHSRSASTPAPHTRSASRVLSSDFDAHAGELEQALLQQHDERLSTNPFSSAATGGTAATAFSSAASPWQDDEAFARHLQREYDAEAAARLARDSPLALGMRAPSLTRSRASSMGGGGGCQADSASPAAGAATASSPVKAPSAPPMDSAAAAAALERQPDPSDCCVICLSGPQEAGFLHGSTVHRCCCRACARELRDNGTQQCPLCRERIDQVILAVY